MDDQRRWRNSNAHPRPGGKRVITIQLGFYLPAPLQRRLSQLWAHTSVRAALLITVVVLIGSQIIPVIQASLNNKSYTLTSVNGLLPQTSSTMASKLQYEAAQDQYAFNSNYAPSSGIAGTGGPLITATAQGDPTKGIAVTDPMNNATLVMKPQFQLEAAKQDQNRVYYPLADGTGWVVYTMQADGVREDIALTHAGGDTMKAKFDLSLGTTFAARKTSDGSVEIFGSSLPINGQVSTGSAKDAALLQKLRQNAAKNELLFTLPAPVVNETGNNQSNVKASYSLSGSELTLNVSGLSKGHYPVDIDPSVYVQSAVGLMYGNNETNVNFDTADNLLEKTPVSGGNIRDGTTNTSWSNTTALPAGRFNMGTAIAAGTIYTIGGSSGATNVTTVYWAPINTSDNTIGSWTTNTAYNLPAALSSFSVVAYNDYLYVIGGYNTGTAAVVNTVYELHVAVNGEPTPTWTSTTTLSANLEYTGAVAYQNEMYVIGGQSTRTNTGLLTTYSAPINPDGTLGSWTAQTNLTAATFAMGAVAYDGYIYSVGGVVATATVTTVAFAKISSPGTLSAWQTTNSFVTARSTSGGNFVTIWAGYMYISGGCTTVNGTGFCTATPQGDIQEASVAADGTLSTWTTLKFYNGTSFASISHPLFGYGLLSFGSATAGGTLYTIGGCAAALNGGTGACTTALTTTSMATISSEGDVGPAIATTSLPATGTPGLFATAVVINNGFIYSIGGCTNNGCTTTTATIEFAPINSDGTLGAWTAATNGLSTAWAAVGATVYDNTIYTFGGATGSGDVRTADTIPLTAAGDTGTVTATTNVLAAAATYVFTFAHVNPANPAQGFVYTVGGCTTTSGIGCSTTGYLRTVQKCTITAAGAAITAAGCTTTGQLQLPSLNAGGIGIAAGAVYDNYAYLSSGANGETSGTAGTWGGQTDTTYYVEINSSGNLVDPPNQTATTWPTVSGLLASNGVTDDSSDNAPGQRRRASAYAVNGYLYVLAGHDAEAASGAGDTLQDMEIGKIDPSTGDIASFVDVFNQITPRWDFKGAAANGFIYAVGGCSAGAPPSSCSAEDRAVQYIQVYNNYSGSPASYTAATNMTNPVIGASSAIYNGRIYVAGGATTFGGTPTKEVQYASINNDGSLGTWTTITSGTGSLGTARENFKLLVSSSGFLYAIGGQSGTAATTALNTTEHSQINAGTGVPGAFSADATMTAARTGLDAVLYNGFIYATGGENASSVMSDTVEDSQINTGTNALGTWSTSGNGTFTDARMFHMAVAYNGTLYILGGFDGTNYLNDVQYAQINTNGTIGTFNTTANMPQPVSQGSAFASNGYLYVLAGRSSAATTACTDNTYVASISANSTVANGNVPNGLGNWSQTSINLTAPRYASTASYANGKAYVLGGSQCATNTVVTAATSSNYGTLQSQPQIAQYSYAIDALNDVFPVKSLFNGIDNGIGASWVLDYESSTQINDNWGVDVVFGKTTLGTPQAFIPENDIGANTNFARWYWLEVTIDDSQAFGYPEDVTRGPTIDNFLLEFVANPSKRLRNGKTFINNVQQPLDTPF